MANLTAITGNWHQTAGSNTSFGGVATTAADNITIPNGVTVTIVSGVVALCRSLTVENGATLIFGNSTSTLNIGDATLGTGNVALSIGSTATITYTSGTPSIQFLSTNSTAQTITTNGKTLPNVTFNGAGGKWQLQDALTCSVLTVTAGHFDSGSQNISATRFLSSNNNVRTISLGSSIISLSTDADLSSVGNLTWTANTAVLRWSTQSGISSGNQFDYQGLSLEWTAIGSVGATLFGAGIFKDLTCVGAAPTAFLSLNNNPVFTGTVSLSGNSSTNRLLVQSNTLGTPRVITAAAVSLTDVDFMDISIVGPVGSTITSDSFNRAVGALAGSTSDAADGGAGLVWSGPSQIVTNRVRMASYYSSWVDLGVTNQYVEAILSWDAGATGYWGVMLRYSASNSNIVFTVYPSINFTIGYLNGTGASFVSTNSPGAWVSGDKMGVAVVGNIYLIYRNNVLVLSGVLPSNAPTTGAGAGFSCIGNASNKEYVDNFKAYPIPNVTGTRLGDCLGNSGIEFTTASGTPRDGGGAGVKRYAVAAGNWSSTAMWSETDGGSPGASVPLPQDDVYIKRSFSSETITIDMPRLCRLLDFTGSTGTLHTSQLVTTATIFGSLVLANIPGNLLASNIRLLGKSNTITTNSRTFINANASLVIDGSYTMTDQLFVGGDLSSIYGSLNTGSYAISCGRFMFSYSGTLNLGSSSITITQTGAATPAWTVSSLVNLSAASSTITFALDAPIASATSSAAATHTFAGGDKSYGTLTYTVADSPGALTITGSNTFGTVNIGSGRSLKLTSGTTQKIGTLNLNGVPRGGVRLVEVSGSYLSTLDSAAVSLSDLDIRVRVLLSDWTPATTTPFVTKQTGASAATISYNFYLDTSGNLVLRCADGAAYSTATSTVATGITDGAAAWVRVARRMSDGRVQFFTAADSSTMPSSWTQLGADAANSRTQDTADPVLLGAGYSGTGVAQTLRRVQMRNNVLDDGTGIVFDVDFTNQFGPFYVDSSTNGAIVTPQTTLANVGDGRVVIESVTAGSAATLQVDTVTGMNYVDLKDVVMNGADTYIEATSVIRSNVKGVRRGPQTGMSMMGV